MVDAPQLGPDGLAGDCTEAEYLATGDVYYVSCVGLQGGWEGFKGRYFTTDRLLSFHLMLRIDRGKPDTQSLTIPGDADGFLFVHSMGLRGEWRLLGGTVKLQRAEHAIHVEGEATLELRNPLNAVASQEAEDAGKIILRRTLFASDLGVLAKVLAEPNLRIEPELRSWTPPAQSGER